jgi:hypothetical protein
MNESPTLADILGPWQQPDCESGLIARCRAAWTRRISTLERGELATLLHQKIAVAQLAPLARTKLAEADDGTECDEGELAAALRRAERDSAAGPNGQRP